MHTQTTSVRLDKQRAQVRVCEVVYSHTDLPHMPHTARTVGESRVLFVFCSPTLSYNSAHSKYRTKPHMDRRKAESLLAVCVCAANVWWWWCAG